MTFFHLRFLLSLLITPELLFSGGIQGAIRLASTGGSFLCPATAAV